MANTAPTRIRTAEDIHQVRTVADYHIAHEKALGRLRVRGMNVSMHAAPDGQPVIINGGRAVISCDCGGVEAASVMLDEARCFACGAIYRHLTVPSAWDDICDVLLARPVERTRNWGQLIEPGTVQQLETADDLKAQNRERGDAESRSAMLAARQGGG